MSKLSRAFSALALTAPVALSSGIGEGGALPDRIKILDWGDNVARTGGKVLKVTDKTVAALAANQAAHALDTVVLDYEHQSLPGHSAYKPDPREHAGHGTIEVVAGEGIYYLSARYTDSGKKHAESYPDVSAVACTNEDGDVVLIHSVALTKAGDVEGMEFKAASSILAALNAGQPTENNTMEKDLQTALIALLKKNGVELSEDATVEDIVAAANKAVEAEPVAASADEDPVAMSADVKTILKEVVALSGRLTVLETGTTTDKRQALIDRASREGKVIPLGDATLKIIPLSALEEMVNTIPATVPLAKGGELSALSAKSPGSGLSPEAIALSAQFGLTEAELKSANGIK